MIDSFAKAKKYLFAHIPTVSPQRFPGELGLKREKHLLQLIGNPQEKLKVIHIAGTSGKGSVCFYISQLLQASGFKVGLHISPHLVNVRERCQINNKFIDEKTFYQSLNKIVPFVDQVTQSKYGKPTYFEILVTLVFSIFSQQKVDYAVIETGLGGLLDGTNVVSRKDKLCVLTKIGFDHMAILGKTLSQIARQKAGIIQKDNQVISIDQSISVKKVFEKKVITTGSQLIFIKKNVNFKNAVMTPTGLFFAWYFSGKQIKKIFINTKAFYQAENSSLALTALYLLSQRDHFVFDETKIRRALQKPSFHGRMEIVNKNGVEIILDGAHNPQKMKAFLFSLQKLYPRKKYNFLISFKKDKDYGQMLKLIIPHAKKIFITDFAVDNQELIQISQDPVVIGQTLRRLGFKNYKVIKNPKKAVFYLLQKKPFDFAQGKQDFVITGSLYLLSSIYNIVTDLKPHSGGGI